MAPILNNFRPNKFQPRRKVLNFITKQNKQIPVKRLKPVFHRPNYKIAPILEPAVEPVVEPIAEPIAEPVARELSKPIDPRRSKLARKPK